MRLQVQALVTAGGVSGRNLLTIVLPLNRGLRVGLLLLRGVWELYGHSHGMRDKGKSSVHSHW